MSEDKNEPSEHEQAVEEMREFEKKGEVPHDLSEWPQGVPDEIWGAAARHYGEQGMAALVLQIALENVWNRLNNAVRQPADAPWG